MKTDPVSIREVRFYDDAERFASAASAFLRTRPVYHNLILTLLKSRLEHPEPGRFWIIFEDGHAAGAVFQSPLSRAALLTPMEPHLVKAVVDAMSEPDIVLPGVNGEAATAAAFAGLWAEKRKAAAFPVRGYRLYEMTQLHQPETVEGSCRKAAVSELELLVSWLRMFHEEVQEPVGDSEGLMRMWLAEGNVWLWQTPAPVSMVISRRPAEGVVRVSGVYTPKEHRRCGYAEACVSQVSKMLTARGHTCVLYTDLGNPTPNSIYRRIGYEAVSEILHYRFE